MNKILVIFLFLSIVQIGATQNKDSISVDLSEIVVQENRMALPFSESSRNIAVITRAEIEAAPVISVAELLRYVSGVDIRQRGAHGVQADISIRGGTFDQTLVLINGIKMSDPQTGHHALNLPVDIENIERIEVLKGPGARIFGQNAFTGAVNIITKTPDDQFVKVNVQAGAHTLGGVKISASMPSKQVQQYFSFSKDFSEGYRYNTDYNINNFFYQAHVPLGEQQLKVLAGYTERFFGANGFYASPSFTDQYEAIQTSIGAIEYQHIQGNWVVKPRLYWRRNQDEYLFVRSNPSIYRNLHIGNTVDGEVNASLQSSLGVTGMGIDLNSVMLQSNNLGERQRFVTSVFLEHRFSIWNGLLDVTPGVLLNYFSDFDVNFLPGIDAGLKFSNEIKLYANAGYTYRVPTFTDLYYEDRANVGNPNLEPEAAITYEAGVKYQNQFLFGQLSVFRRDGRNMIDWTKSAPVDSVRWRPSNFAEIDVAGAEASFSFRLPSNKWLQHFDLSYTYLDASIQTEDVELSRYALDNLRHQVIAGVEHRVFSQLFHSVRYRYVDRVNLEDYSLVDLRLMWKTSKTNLFLEATNLFNQTYTETNLVEMPGRWIRAGASMTFKNQ